MADHMGTSGTWQVVCSVLPRQRPIEVLLKLKVKSKSNIMTINTNNMYLYIFKTLLQSYIYMINNKYCRLDLGNI